MVDLNFNANDVEPSNDFDVLPVGWYRAEIVGSEMKETKRGDGSYLALQYRILGPASGGDQYENRRVFCNLNLNNQNPKAVEIAERHLGDICRATGILTVNNSTQLHEKPHMIKLSIRKSEEYGDRNEIKGFKPMSGPGATAAASSGTSGGPGWARR
jgi:hypothetical protein